MQMLKEIEEAFIGEDKYFSRNDGRITDPNIDASLLGHRTITRGRASGAGHGDLVRDAAVQIPVRRMHACESV